MDSTYNLNGGFKPTLKRFADLAHPIHGLEVVLLV